MNFCISPFFLTRGHDANHLAGCGPHFQSIGTSFLAAAGALATAVTGAVLPGLATTAPPAATTPATGATGFGVGAGLVGKGTAPSQPACVGTTAALDEGAGAGAIFLAAAEGSTGSGSGGSDGLGCGLGRGLVEAGELAGSGNHRSGGCGSAVGHARELPRVRRGDDAPLGDDSGDGDGVVA